MRFAYTVLAAAALGALSVPASADALHGFCSYPAPSCSDNGSITPVDNSSPNFGFLKSPNSGTEAFVLVTLIPDNTPGAASQSITIDGTNTGNASALGSLFGSGWTSGKLADYFHISASPANPIGAFLPLTQAEDPGAAGYQAYTFNFGDVTFGAGTDPMFHEGYVFPAGAIILGFSGFPGGDWTATANSAALIITSGGTGSHNPGLPEPATLALMGTALAGFFAARRKRNQKAAA